MFWSAGGLEVGNTVAWLLVIWLLHALGSSRTMCLALKTTLGVGVALHWLLVLFIWRVLFEQPSCLAKGGWSEPSWLLLGALLFYGTKVLALSCHLCMGWNLTELAALSRILRRVHEEVHEEVKEVRAEESQSVQTEESQIARRDKDGEHVEIKVNVLVTAPTSVSVDVDVVAASPIHVVLN